MFSCILWNLIYLKSPSLTMDLLSESGWVWSSRRFRRENTCHCHNHRWDYSPFVHHLLTVDLRFSKNCQTTGMLCVWGKKTLELKERQQLGGGGAQSVKVSNHFFVHGGISCVLQVLRDHILVAVSEYILILDHSCQVSFAPPSSLSTPPGGVSVEAVRKRSSLLCSIWRTLGGRRCFQVRNK